MGRARLNVKRDVEGHLVFVGSGNRAAVAAPSIDGAPREVPRCSGVLQEKQKRRQADTVQMVEIAFEPIDNIGIQSRIWSVARSTVRYNHLFMAHVFE